MRWRFFDPSNREELAARQAVLDRIDAWWQVFQRTTDRLDQFFSGKSRWDLPGWMSEHLQTIEANLMWEFGPAVKSPGHRLVITPESRHHLLPLIAAILARAPKLEGWELYHARPPEELEQVTATVEGRTGFDIGDFAVRISRGDLRRVDLAYSSAGFPSECDQASNYAAFVTTESLLGERCLDRWIGGIAISPISGRKNVRPPHSLPLERMKETVDALIESLREQLPDSPHHEWIKDAKWTIWKLEPDRSLDDWPGQKDLYVGKSANSEMWTTAHSGRSFYSERFSRCGETFCYVKLDGSQGLDTEKFKDKSEIEDALEEVLKPAGLGCHVGGGTGLRYSYIDLALTDLDSGIRAVRERLREGNVSRRSWIQFHDADLAAEWVGIYEDSPPPPMEESGE